MDSYLDNRRVGQLIYGGEILTEEEYDAMLDKIDDFPREMEHGCRKLSLYLQLFEDMVNTVYEHESHLLSQSEWDVFATLKYYCYNARYCLVRLVLRKPDQWHALSSLESYKKEVGEVGLVRAITDLCRPWYEIMNGTGEELDVNADSGMRSEVKELIIGPDEDIKISISQSYDEEAGPSNTSARSSSTLSDSDFLILSQENLQEVRLDSFCFDESTMNMTDFLNQISVK
ncbi:hypothetical protein APHAL10511_000900 [Amanita phalloides]|nr:hypothetical protein APHAL10511_000900 [Amanita phalloides]